jgi:hypothetical protein
MGQSQSNVQSLQNRYDKTHADIVNVADEVVRDAIGMGWDADNPTLCERIDFLYDQMFDWATTESLRQAGVRIGLSLTPYVNNEETERAWICQNILFYLKIKVNIATYVRDNLNRLCEDQMRYVPQTFDYSLDGSGDAVKSEAWKRVEKGNEVISDWYAGLEKLMRRLLLPMTLQQLQRLEREIVDWLNRGYRECCVALTNLRDFMWTPVVDEQSGQQYYYNPYSLPGEHQTSLNFPAVGARPGGLSPKVSMGSTTCAQSQVDLSVQHDPSQDGYSS